MTIGSHIYSLHNKVIEYNSSDKYEYLASKLLFYNLKLLKQKTRILIPSESSWPIKDDNNLTEPNICIGEEYISAERLKQFYIKIAIEQLYNKDSDLNKSYITNLKTLVIQQYREDRNKKEAPVKKLRLSELQKELLEIKVVDLT